MGSPGKLVREMSDDDAAKVARAADVYVRKAKSYPAEMVKVG